jgi:large subunit ribosomal protein L17
MLKNMATSLILHKRIQTTLAKAKELRKYVEPLLTRSKEDNTHNRRVIFSYLTNKEVVKELFSTVSDKIADRPGGYTRIVKLGTRLGDNAEMCLIELVDFNETLLEAASEKATKTRRSRRGGAGKPAVAATEPTIVDAVAEVVEDAPVAETVEDAPVAEEIAEVEEVSDEVVNAADDLEIVEGIGPKIAEALANVGVLTYAQLADMTPDAINEIISNAGISSRNTDTWPKQAELARDGKFDELKTWQDELNAGKE